MDLQEHIEFIVMLLIENRTDNSFYEYLDKHYNLEEFNKRYEILLDKFMSKYALNKTEKSD